MTWTKLGTEFFDQLVAMDFPPDLDDACQLTHAQAIHFLYSIEAADHRFRKTALRRFATSPKATEAAEWLVKRGAWTDHGRDYEVTHHAEVFRQSLGYQLRERARVAQTKNRRANPPDPATATRSGTRTGTQNATRTATRSGTQNATRTGTRSAVRAQTDSQTSIQTEEATTEELPADTTNNTHTTTPDDWPEVARPSATRPASHARTTTSTTSASTPSTSTTAATSSATASPRWVCRDCGTPTGTNRHRCPACYDAAGR